jgi:hypothetical protein
VIHLYALAEGEVAGDLSGISGVDAAPVRQVAVPPLRAVVSEHERAPRVSRQRALEHARATLDVCRRCPATPVRYGAHHVDVAALRDAVAEREADLLASVRRVGGHLEVVVRFADEPAPLVTPAGEDVAPEDVGRTYLEDRRRRLQAEREASRVAAAELREATAGLDPAATSVVEHDDGRRGPERCWLVAHGDADGLAASARRLARADDRLVVGGPWPPYTFA